METFKYTSSLTRFFNPCKSHPILSKKGKNFGNLISWMISSTDTFEDKSFVRIPRENKRKKRKICEKTFVKKSDQEKPKKYFNICRLCKQADSTESREHILSECPDKNIRQT